MNSHVSVILLSGLIGSFSGYVQIMSTDKSVHSSLQPAALITISSPSPSVRLDQPLILNISVRNTSTKDIFVSDELGGGEADYDVVITEGEGLAEPATTAYYRAIKGNRLPDDPRFGGSHSRNIVILKPGGNSRNTLDIKRLYLINQPGKYKVFVERLDQISKTRLTSNTITISVVP